MQPLLFYSDSCPHSRRIVARLQQTPDANKVLRLACVDGQIERIPAEIDRVPALVVPTSSGNRVVFDSELYDWLNSILRMDDSKRRQAPTPQVPHPAMPPPQRNMDQPFPPTMSAPHSGPPQDFMDDSGAFLTDFSGNDAADHLFAGAGEEIRLNYAGAGADTGGRRGGEDDEARNADVLNRMMASRNEEISSVYADIPRPI
eukprot:jgi/Tetstr1/464119/TSEL_008924.t1